MLPRVLAITDWSRPGLLCYVLTVFVNNLLDVSNYKCYSAFIFSCLSCRVKQRSKFWLTWLKEFLYKFFQSLYAVKETDRQIPNNKGKNKIKNNDYCLKVYLDFISLRLFSSTKISNYFHCLCLKRKWNSTLSKITRHLYIVWVTLKWK